MGVRLEERVVAGERVWVEADRPRDCPDRHGRIGATWWPCSSCGVHCRHWPCRAEGCDYVKADPMHACANGLAPESRLRGG